MCIFNLLYVSFGFTYSWPSKESQFSKTDCYESFTIPKVVFKLHHHNPSGPPFLFVKFHSDIYYLSGLRGAVSLIETLHFKNIEGPCINSLTLSTMEMRIHRMYIVIKIYFSLYHNQMSYMHYIFENGFTSDNYLFIDQYANFGLSIKVIYSEKKFVPYLPYVRTSWKKYVNSLSIKQKEICVVTENNLRVIIRPNYKKTLLDGFIFRINAIFNSEEKFVELFEYDAFECQATEPYINETTVFISENYPKFNLYFKAIYSNIHEDVFVSKEVSFTLDYINLYNVDNLPYFPPNVKKVFLMKNPREYITCQWGIRPYFFKSKNGVIYLVREQVQIEYYPFVKNLIQLTYSQTNSC